jgi:hypothetical protein
MASDPYTSPDDGLELERIAVRASARLIAFPVLQLTYAPTAGWSILCLRRF